jgi:spermidine/putrescine-binding protein
MPSPFALSRRRFIGAGAGGAAAFAFGGLAGCGNPNDDRLKFYNWQDYIADGLLTDFEAGSGIAVSYSTYASNDELGDRLALAGVPRRGNRKATSFDLIVPSDNLFRRLRDQNRLQPFDATVVTETLLENLEPVLRSLEIDPGNRYGIPWATGATGIGYDTTVFTSPPDWTVFTSAEQAGKMTLLDERREAFAAAHYVNGTDPNSTDGAEVDAAADTIATMLANAALDAETYLARLASGELVAAQAFSTDVLQAQQDNPNLAFVIPPQGGTRWVDLLCIPEDAPNADGANRFVAAYLDPRLSASNAVAIRADTGNQAAREFLPAELLAEPAAFPNDADAARLIPLLDLGDAESLYNDAWERVRSTS